MFMLNKISESESESESEYLCNFPFYYAIEYIQLK